MNEQTDYAHAMNNAMYESDMYVREALGLLYDVSGVGPDIVRAAAVQAAKLVKHMAGALYTRARADIGNFYDDSDRGEVHAAIMELTETLRMADTALCVALNVEPAAYTDGLELER